MRSFVFGKRSWRPCYDRSAQAAQEGFFLSPAGGRIFDVGAGGRDVDPWKPPGGRGVAQSSVRGHFDGKTFKKLIMLDREALVELRDLSQELIDFMGGA